jgi:peptidyl-prolyl cis-trans isomerase A (cyclophilin A)
MKFKFNMKKTVLFLMVFSILLAFACLDKKTDKKDVQIPKRVVDMDSLSSPSNPEVVVKTNKGDFYIELYEKEAPITVQNFLNYVDGKFYDKTIFHRVISNFMIQGGGFTKDMNQKPAAAPIKNEADNGLRNVRGTIAMARTNIVDSATSQFFINVQDNPVLDHGARDYGYAVFGKVTTGMDVVYTIRGVKTGSVAGHQDVPVQPVVIESINRVDK